MSEAMLRATLLCAAVLALASRVHAMDDEMAELAKMLRENCGGETGVDLSLIDKVNAGTALTTLPDPKLKCYIKCLMETAGMLSEGEVDVETCLALFPEDLRERQEHVVRGCATQKGADDCDTAYLTQACWQKGSGKDYYLV